MSNSTYQREYAKKLTKKLFEYIELPQDVQVAVVNENSKQFDKELAKLVELIRIDKNYYRRSFIQNLSDNPQRIYFLTWPIPAKKLTGLVLSKIMELFTNDKLESKEIVFQAVADSLGEYIIGYLRYVYNNNEKIQSIDDVLETAIGAYFINLVIEKGYVEKRFIPDEKKELRKLFLSKEFLSSLSKTERDFIKSAPFRYEPMVIEPLEWQGMYGGGYLQDHFKFKLPLKSIPKY